MADGSHLGENGSMVFASVPNAVRRLLEIDNPSSLNAIVLALADATRELPQIATDQAVIANVNPQEVAAAQQLIQQGDASVASADFAGAILSFQHAWQRVSQQ